MIHLDAKPILCFRLRKTKHYKIELHCPTPHADLKIDDSDYQRTQLRKSGHANELVVINIKRTFSFHLTENKFKLLIS